MALVVPDEEVIMKWAADNEKAGAFPQLCKSEVRREGRREGGRGTFKACPHSTTDSDLTGFKRAHKSTFSIAQETRLQA